MAAGFYAAGNSETTDSNIKSMTLNLQRPTPAASACSPEATRGRGMTKQEVEEWLRDAEGISSSSEGKYDEDVSSQSDDDEGTSS